MSRPNSASVCPTDAPCNACTNVIHCADIHTATRNDTISAPSRSMRGTRCSRRATSGGGWFTQ